VHLLQIILAVLVVGLFTLVGLPMACAGLMVFLQRLYLTVFGERTTAVVVGMVDRRDDEPSDGPAVDSSRFLRLSFKDCGGREHRVTTDTSVSAKSFRRGDSVPVLYRVARPTTFVVDRFWLKWTLPLVFGGLGLLLLTPLMLAVAHALRRP
jgi:hypothetical protein